MSKFTGSAPEGDSHDFKEPGTLANSEGGSEVGMYMIFVSSL